MKNTVIFDLDGLLIDSEIISFRLYEELTGKYGRRWKNMQRIIAEKPALQI